MRVQNIREEQEFQDLFARAGAGGNATIDYYISGATPGYRVVASVRVAHDGRSELLDLVHPAPLAGAAVSSAGIQLAAGGRPPATRT